VENDEALKQNIENLQEVTQRVFNKVTKTVGDLPKYVFFFSNFCNFSKSNTRIM
jgi:hypothetical protein